MLLDSETINRLAVINARLQENSNDIHALIEKAYLLFHPFFDTEGALAALDLVDRLDPKNVDSLFWRATILVQNREDYLVAKKVLEQALKIDPNRSDCHDLLGGVLSALKIDEQLSINHVR